MAREARTSSPNFLLVIGVRGVKREGGWEGDKGEERREAEEGGEGRGRRRDATREEDGEKREGEEGIERHLVGMSP